MHHTRERHNAKARQSTAGQRKKGKRKAGSTEIREPDHDPNSEIIIPKSEEQKELDRRDRMKQEVRICFVHFCIRLLMCMASGTASGANGVASQ